MYIEKHFKDDFVFFDLENFEDLARLDNPMVALKDLKLDYLYVIYPGRSTFSLRQDINAEGLEIARYPS